MRKPFSCTICGDLWYKYSEAAREDLYRGKTLIVLILHLKKLASSSMTLTTQCFCNVMDQILSENY